MPTHHLTHRLTYRRLPWGDYRGVYIYYTIDYVLCRIYSTYCAYAKYKKGDRKKIDRRKFKIPPRPPAMLRRSFGVGSTCLLRPYFKTHFASSKNVRIFASGLTPIHQ